MNVRRNRWLAAGSALALLCLGWTGAAHAADDPTATSPKGRFALVTLGTLGGPLPSATRSQPSNLLTDGQRSYLVDTGDGTANRMSAAGAAFASLRGIFLTHHHFDHIGGLFAILGLRFQLDTPGPLTIYGPRGTKTIVASLLAAMRPSAEARYGVPGETFVPPDRGIDVVELTDGATVRLDGLSVSAIVNSHYSFERGGGEYEKHQSLSYRFDFTDRSIVFTGDSGPSAALEQLARGADILVSEMIDLPNTMAKLEDFAAALPPHIKQHMGAHFAQQHLSPRQAGELARRSGVGAVILSHLAGIREDAQLQYLREVNGQYKGPLLIARDLDRF